MSFVEEPKDQRVSHRRAEEAIETGASTVAVGCPFCATMLEDAVKSKAGEHAPKIKDVAEILWDAIEQSEEGEKNGSESVRI